MTKEYPRVLIVTISRLNASDTSNNGLLLRNLFAEWPQERLAQIYSGGGNNDKGFCGHNYQIGVDERNFGKLFFKLKGHYSEVSDTKFPSKTKNEHFITKQQISKTAFLKQKAGQYLMDSGIYELIFRIRLSKPLLNWISSFNPDIILAQGYNLSFTWLPIFIKDYLKKPLVYYASDDWPNYLYTSHKGLCVITAPLMKKIVDKSTKRLFADTDVAFSFNGLMSEEYEKRYDKPFIPLMHCDTPERFHLAKTIHLQPRGVKSIIATGAFDDSRWPLLLDLEEACQRLNEIGIPIRATILTLRISQNGYHRIKSCRFLELLDDPGHELLPSYLKGADILYLPETFDPSIAQGYRYSISTKAHLFMFSQRPILVYGHPSCGLVNYAKREKWANVVDERNIDLLIDSLQNLLLDSKQCEEKRITANEVAMRNNNCITNRNLFLSNLLKCV